MSQIEERLYKPRRKRDKSYEDLVNVINRRKAKKDGKIVYPGKGLTASEIRSRMRNRSLIPGTEGLSYTDEKEVATIQGMSKIDLMRSHANEIPKLKESKAILDAKAKEIEAEAKRRKEKADRAKIEAEIKAKLAKEKEGKNG